MNKLDVKLSAIFGLSLFGTLYVISAIGLVTVGVYAIMEEGIVLSIKTPLWVGGAVFMGGILTVGIALYGKVCYLKSQILLVISGASFLLCFASMILLEFAEKVRIFQPTRHKGTGPDTSETFWRSPYVIYLVYLISSVIGMVSAVVGFLYIYCILIAPVRKQQWKSYQAQTQTQAKNQDQALDHHPRTKYTFKGSPTRRGTKSKTKGREHRNDLPESSWIYESQSIHSLTTTPTRTFPINKETQLKKDVVEELRHNSTFKVHRNMTRPSPSPVPPPLPPITPSALGSAPSLPGHTEGNGLDDQNRCTAKSLEHYPIPRKYSLRGSSRRSNHSRQHPSSLRQTSPQEHGNAGEGAVNFAVEHHGMTDVSKQNLGQEHEQGHSNEHHSTFQMERCNEISTDEKMVAPFVEVKPLQTPVQEGSHPITLQPVPVKRKCSKRSSKHHPSVTLPGYDQIRSPPSNPPQDSVHCEGQTDLPPAPVQHQGSRPSQQKPVRHINGEENDKHTEGVQKGYRGNPWEIHQGPGASADLQAHPVPNQRSVHPVGIKVNSMYSQENAWETEAPQMTQTQIHQLYQSSQSDKIKPGVPGQQKLDQQGYIHIQNPCTLQDSSTDITDLATSSVQQQSDKPVASPRPSPKPKLQHQSNVAEASEGPPAPLLHRRSTRKVHERIQAMQEKLWMDSSNPDSSNGKSDQLPVIPSDEVDHLTPRLAANNVQEDNIQDFYVTSTRL